MNNFIPILITCCVLYSCSSEILESPVDQQVQIEQCIQQSMLKDTAGLDPNYVAYKNNYEKWKCWDINHYRITSRWHLRGSVSCIIEVMDGEIIAADTTNVLYDRPASCSLEDEHTINYAFDRIQLGFDKDTPTITIRDVDYYGYDRIRVKYDSIYGFPKEVYLDPTTDYIDEEYGLTLSDFEILE